MYLCYVCHSMSDGLMYQQFNNIILLNEGASLFARLRVWLKGSGGQSASLLWSVGWITIW